MLTSIKLLSGHKDNYLKLVLHTTGLFIIQFFPGLWCASWDIIHYTPEQKVDLLNWTPLAKHINHWGESWITNKKQNIKERIRGFIKTEDIVLKGGGGGRQRDINRDDVRLQRRNVGWCHSHLCSYRIYYRYTLDARLYSHLNTKLLSPIFLI